MKRIAILILASVCFCSCEKMLDTPTDGRVEMKEIFTKLDRTRAYLESCYQYLPYKGAFYENQTLLASFSDEAQDSKDHLNGNIQRWYEGQLSPTNNIITSTESSWSRSYEGIFKCNTFLENILDTVNMKTLYLEIDERDAMIAQVRVLRAFYYLQLIQQFGGVPVTSGRYDVGQDLSQEGRQSFAKCVDYIIADCEAALKTPELPNSISSRGFRWRMIQDSEQGKFTRAVACAVISRAALYAASPLWAEDYNGTLKYTWTRAASITKKALDLCLLNGYELFTNKTATAQNAYASYFLATWNSTTDYETIYRRPSGQQSIWQYQGLPINQPVGQIRAGACPSQELVDSYELFDKVTKKSVPFLVLSNPYINGDHTKPNINPDAEKAPFFYNENSARAMYFMRDPRFVASIYFDSTSCAIDTGIIIATRSGGNCEISDKLNSDRNTRTGYYVRKFNDYRSNQNRNLDGYMSIFRLAELYMNFAEAAYNAGNPDKLYLTIGISGIPSEVAANTARDAVNRIRERAGLQLLPNGMANTEFELRYRNERRVEFAFEEFRFFDVRRWQAPHGNLEGTDKVVSGMKIEIDKVTLALKTTRFTFPNRLTYDNKYLIMPIKYDEISKMRIISGSSEGWQNPGW